MEYSEFQSKHMSRDPRRRRRRMRRRLYFCLSVACILLLSLAITAVIDGGKEALPAESTEQTEPGQISVLAPLPFENSTYVEPAAVEHAFGPTQQETLSLQTMDYAHISLPACGQVSTDYFADAAFLGDSITEGFTEYGIELSGALICGYIGASPNSVVNRTTLHHPERGDEIALDVLGAAQPAKLYVLLGANALTAQGNDDSFLAYYGQMLDMLKEALPNTIIYVQSLTPVQASVTAAQPGLDNNRFLALNQSLAQMAYEKGCKFLDLYAAFADESGVLSADYAQPDGLHFTVSGYSHWVDYLCRHTVYSAGNPWLSGSAFSAVTLPQKTEPVPADSDAQM